MCGSLLGISSSTKNCTQSLSNQSAHSAELLTKKKGLIKTIQEKEDSLRKLKLVKMYRKKVLFAANLPFYLTVYNHGIRIQ